MECLCLLYCLRILPQALLSALFPPPLPHTLKEGLPPSTSFGVQATCGFMAAGRHGGEGAVLEVVTVMPDGDRADISGRGQAALPPCSWLVRGV